MSFPQSAQPIIVGWVRPEGDSRNHGVSARSVSTTWGAVRIYRTAFVEDHDVIQTIAANLSDHALDVFLKASVAP